MCLVLNIFSEWKTSILVALFFTFILNLIQIDDCVSAKINPLIKRIEQYCQSGERESSDNSILSPDELQSNNFIINIHQDLFIMGDRRKCSQVLYLCVDRVC